MIKKTETKSTKTKKTKTATVKEEKKQSVKTRPVKPTVKGLASTIAKNKSKDKITRKPIETPTMENFPTVKKGDEGGYVTLLQTNLKNRGYYDGPVDGKFGANTEKALNEFQKDSKKPQNSMVGPKTWELLQKSTIVKVKPEPPKADIQPQQVRAIFEQPKTGISVVVEGLTRYQADLLLKLLQGHTECHII